MPKRQQQHVVDKVETSRRPFPRAWQNNHIPRAVEVRRAIDFPSSPWCLHDFCECATQTASSAKWRGLLHRTYIPVGSQPASNTKSGKTAFLHVINAHMPRSCMKPRCLAWEETQRVSRSPQGLQQAFRKGRRMDDSGCSNGRHCCVLANRPSTSHAIFMPVVLENVNRFRWWCQAQLVESHTRFVVR